MQVLKLKMTDIVDIALISKPTTIYRNYLDHEEMTIDVIKLMLIQFQDFYNTKSKMNDAQLTETAYLICQTFRHFNYYDIGVCLKMAKTQEKVYDRIDGGMIMEWLTRFDIDRTGMIVNKREQQMSEHNSNWSSLAERTSNQPLKDFLKG